MNPKSKYKEWGKKKNWQRKNFRIENSNIKSKPQHISMWVGFFVNQVCGDWDLILGEGVDLLGPLFGGYENGGRSRFCVWRRWRNPESVKGMWWWYGRNREAHVEVVANTVLEKMVEVLTVDDISVEVAKGC